MKPVHQTKFGGADAPESEQGNCMQAALATALELDLEDVPDFSGKIVNGEWYFVLTEWLATLGLGLHVEKVGSGPPPGVHLCAVKSTTLANPDDGHLVVVQDGNLAHDPNPRADGIGEREEYWIFVPLDPARARRAMERSS